LTHILAVFFLWRMSPFLCYDRTVSFFQNEFTPLHWKDTGVERNMKVGGKTNSMIPSIFDHVVRNSSTIKSNYHFYHHRFLWVLTQLLQKI